jgi:hypothetical protein
MYLTVSIKRIDGIPRFLDHKVLGSGGLILHEAANSQVWVSSYRLDYATPMFRLPNVVESRKLDPRMRSELSGWLAQSLNTRHQLAVALQQDPACLELTNLDIPRLPTQDRGCPCCACGQTRSRIRSVWIPSPTGKTGSSAWSPDFHS